MNKHFLIIGITILLICVGLCGCIIPTYEDEEGTHLGFPPDYESNLDEKPVINILELENEIHYLINIERQNHGLPSLEYDYWLADIARDHSKEMAVHGYFSHYNSKGQDPTARAKAVGYPCYKDYGSYYTDGIAENIFQNWLYNTITYYDEVPIYDWSTQNELASSTVSGWMDSYGHRNNILDSSYNKEGIGVAISSDYTVYITQDFW